MTRTEVNPQTSKTAVRFYLLIVTLLFAGAAWAQEVPVQKTDSLSKVVTKETTGQADSAISKLGAATKTLSKVKAPNLANPVNKKMRSMTRVDSAFIFNKDMKKVDSMKIAFQNKSKEIKTRANRKKKEIKHSLDSLQGSYQKQANALTAKFRANNKELWAGHENEIAGKMNLNTPAVSQEFPNVNLNTSMPGSSLNVPTVPITGNFRNISSVPNSSLPNLSLNALGQDIPQAKELQNDSKEIKVIEKQAGAYKNKAKQLKKDSLANGEQAEKWTEDQLQGRKEIKALRDKEQEVQMAQKLQQQYLNQVAKYKSPQKIEAEINQNLTKIANADLLKNDQALKTSQVEMTKAKKKYGEFQSMKNLPKRPLNPMKQLSFRERFFPGIFLQSSNGNFFSLDLAPQAHYKITTRFDLGLGLIYRVNYDFKKSTLVQNHNLYGFKAFANFKIYKSFYFRLESERINRQLPVTNTDVTNYRWTNTLLGGVGKEILISKKIQANTLVLYNALNKYDNPYASTMLFRIGFNLSLKKDQRKEFIRSLHNKF